jgi:uncharacterized repeat protein (TIGR01451 family)
MNWSYKQISRSSSRGSALFNLLAALLVWAAPLQAQADDLVINLVAQRVAQKADGSESLQPAAQAKPGDIIEYTAHYKNQSKGSISNLQPTLPIPQGMEYISATAHPAPVAASLDGKIFSTIPLKRKVKLADGKVQEQEVPASEYRALKWSVKELPTGKTAIFSARVRLATSGQISATTGKINAN